MDTVWLMLWKGHSGSVLLLHLAHRSPTSHYGCHVIYVVLFGEWERGAGKEKAGIAMFTLILAAFYFISDIDSGEKKG